MINIYRLSDYFIRRLLLKSEVPIKVSSCIRLLRLTIYSEEVNCGTDKSVSTHRSLSGRPVVCNHTITVINVMG